MFKKHFFGLMFVTVILCFSGIAKSQTVIRGNTICIDGVCYPIVQQSEPKSSPVVNAAEVKTETNTQAIGFRKSLIKAAEQAREAGEISRADLLRIRFSSLSPANLDRLQKACAEQAVAEGLASSQAIDWNNLISFLKELLPVILEIIKIFA